MMKQIKRAIACLLAMVLLISILPMSVLAGTTTGTEGVLSYRIDNGKVIITDCDTSVTGELVIPETIEGLPVTSIEDSTFSECSGLTSIAIPAGVTGIGNHAFDGCSSLTSIAIPEDVIKIEDFTFNKCNSLTSIVIPAGVTNIGAGAFSGCSSLVNIIIPKSVTRIGAGAFSGCSGLTSIDIPVGVTKIQDAVFSRCSSLTSVSIPEKVTKIGNGAFSGCSSLINIAIPKGITSIERYAFEGCENLIIYGYIGTVAETYASEQGYTFIPINFTLPKAVTNLRATSNGKNKVKLTWTKSQNADGYLIYAQKNGKYSYCGMTTTGTTFTDKKALDSDYNFYWVFPYVKDNAGKMHAGTCTKYVYAKGVCPAVTNLKSSSVTGGVKLTWSKSAGADGYLIYGQVAGNKYAYVGMTTTGTTFTEKKASKTVYNYYWVFPYHKDANGKMIVGGTPKYTYGRAR